jgi:hypothetical protein
MKPVFVLLEFVLTTAETKRVASYRFAHEEDARVYAREMAAACDSDHVVYWTINSAEVARFCPDHHSYCTGVNA